MAATATASTIRYAPEDLNLPKPWRGLVDSRTGYLYFWNTETNVTQYKRPASSSPPKPSPIPVSSSVQTQQSFSGVNRGHSSEKEDDKYNRGRDGPKTDSGSRFSETSNFVELLNSQQDSVLPQLLVFSTQYTEASSIGEDTPAKRRERRKWTPIEDVVLISSWLNTSKDHVVGNEQKSVAFWKRIAAYFGASPKVAGREIREANHCKQRWQKINDLVCKFCGSYEAATREKTSGQSENDVLKLAHEIFYNDHKKKFNLEHAWQELRNDQKWSDLTTSKTDGSSKRRRCEDGAQSSSSHAFSNLDDQATNRPPGVKAAKGRGKKCRVEGKALEEFQSMWLIKEKDLAMKERLSKIGLLDSLIAKKEPLFEYEEALKKKLILDMLSN